MDAIFIKAWQQRNSYLSLTGKGGSQSLHCLCKQCGIWYPNRNHECRISKWTSLDGDTLHTYLLLHFHYWQKNVCSVCPLLWGRAQEAYIESPPDSAYALFPYDLAVYLFYVTVIYLNHEYMLSLLVSLVNLWI